MNSTPVLYETPNTTLLTKQVENPNSKRMLTGETYKAVFHGYRDSFVGFNFNFLPPLTCDNTLEEGEKVHQDLGILVTATTGWRQLPRHDIPP
jgi:hypothetical protein